MKVRFLSVLLSTLSLGTIVAQDNQIYFADPTVFVENGKYYLTGTIGDGPKGFAILESTDLKHWRSGNGDPFRMILSPGEKVFGTDMFWAPQIFKDNGRYYLTYSANEQTAVASSASLTGPYLRDVSDVRPIDGSEKNIDSFIFKDDDGKYYLYHVRFNHGNYIWVAEFDLAKGTIKKETLRQCLRYTEDWEKTDPDLWDPIMEGPTVIKRDGVYYLFYSANHFLNKDYAVGYATAQSPMGPWTKYEGSPIIHRDIVGENGSGHGDFFVGLDGNPYYVYHVHYSDSVVAPRRTRIVPLVIKKNEKTSQCDISVDRENVIVPIIGK